jgi:hypothetical protein
MLSQDLGQDFREGGNPWKKETAIPGPDENLGARGRFFQPSPDVLTQGTESGGNRLQALLAGADGCV